MIVTKKLSFPTFFSNNQFSELFSEEEYVWIALAKLKKYLEEKVYDSSEIHISPYVHLENPSRIFIGKGTIVEPGAYIQGPCYIGNNCLIRHNAYIRGYVLIGDGSLIGHGTEIKNSILLQKVSASHFAYVGDSIIGNEVNLGAGVVCANYRLDGKEITVRIEDSKVYTGLHKLGSIIGDFAQIGCNSVLNPGTFLLPNTLCPPLSCLRGIT